MRFLDFERSKVLVVGWCCVFYFVGVLRDRDELIVGEVDVYVIVFCIDNNFLFYF